MDLTKEDPIAWAEGLVDKHGIDDAYRIVTIYKAPFIGKDGTEANRLASWYERAYLWMTKNVPRPTN